MILYFSLMIVTLVLQIIAFKTKNVYIKKNLFLSIIFFSILIFISGLLLGSITAYLWIFIAAIYVANYYVQ